jgi:hypothetical protein
VYLYLTEARDTSFNDPITKYVPELATCVTENAAELAWDAIGIINWDSMTVGALARHLQMFQEAPHLGLLRINWLRNLLALLPQVHSSVATLQLCSYLVTGRVRPSQKTHSVYRCCCISQYSSTLFSHSNSRLSEIGRHRSVLCNSGTLT